MSQAAVENLRGSFHDRYAIPFNERNMRNPWPRLIECILCVAQADDPDYFQPPASNEFSVVDLRTKEKAWLEIPGGADPNVLTQMIESHFAASSCQVATSLWVV